MKQKVHISEELIEQFVKWTAGYLNHSEFDQLIKSFESELSRYYHSRKEESNLIRIINSVIDKGTFLLDCLHYPHHVEILCALASSSNYLADILVRNPELLYQLFSESYLNKVITEQELNEEIEKGFNIFKRPQTKIKFLKSLKRKYILKIGTNDILKNLPLIEVTRQISLLANAIISALFQLSYSDVLTSKNLNISKRQYCLMSLGKLGGNELNYSSDVDLLVIYDEESLVGPKKNIYYSDILTQTINQFISWSTEFNELGNLYRVDFRLRPDGNTSPLSRSLLDTINYYESRGEQWEKQMLIKLNFVAGSSKLYSTFQSFVHSYVFRMASYQSPLDAISKMKKNIERQYTDKLNIKTTIGGIRDIEFAVQGLQLLNGNKLKELRNGNSLECLHILKSNELLNEDEYKTLSEAYILYRRIEHFLQLLNNVQTHTLPADKEQVIQIAVFLGFNSRTTFEKTLAKHQKLVRDIFESIVVPNKTRKILKTFDQIAFNDPQKAKRNLEFLEFGTGLISKKSFDSKTSERFNNISSELTKYILRSKSPDLIIENFTKVVNGYKAPSILYSELSNRKMLHQFLRILEFSEYSMNLLVEHPPLVENFISKKVFYKDFISIFAESSLKELLFIISCQYTLGLINESRVSVLICEFIEQKISDTFKKLPIDKNIFIAGLGSFALHDINFKSDIDLIVVADDVNKHSGLDEIFHEFIQELKKELFPIEIDFRLRPEGKSSPLVWDVKNYQKYLKDRAGIWEFQSLIKSNFICGDKKVFRKFTDTVYKTLKQKSLDEIRISIGDMHKKTTQLKFSSLGSTIDIKNSSGSFITLDYLLTLNLIGNSRKKDIFVGGQKKINLLKLMFKETPHYFDNYKFLKRLLFTLQIVANWNKAKIPANKDIVEKVCFFLGDIKSVDLNRKVTSIFKDNQNLFKQRLDSID